MNLLPSCILGLLITLPSKVSLCARLKGNSTEYRPRFPEVYSRILAPVFLVCRKVMFSVVTVCLFAHGSRSQVTTSHHTNWSVAWDPYIITCENPPPPLTPDLFKLVHSVRPASVPRSTSKRTIGLRLKSLLVKI